MPAVVRWLVLVTLATCSYNVGTIWMTHLSWRLWRHVGPAEFPAYHRAWWFGWRGIQPIIFPVAAVAALGTLAQLRWRPPRVPRPALWLAVSLQVLTYASTAAWWGRWQGQLTTVRCDDGSLNPFYEHILRTHWLRVALITASGALQVWIAGRARVP